MIIKRVWSIQNLDVCNRFISQILIVPASFAHRECFIAQVGQTIQPRDSFPMWSSAVIDDCEIKYMLVI